MTAEVVPADVAVQHAPEDVYERTWRLARRVCNTEFVPDSFKGRPEAVLAAILYGRELGIGPMQSLQSINVIKGKPSLAPEAMRARVLAAGHSLKWQLSNGSASLTGRRADNGDTETITWTLADAEQAGLVRKDSWRLYPRAMLVARATSELCRLLFPDVIAGASYTPEEREDEQPLEELPPAAVEVVPPVEPEPVELAAIEIVDVFEEDAEPEPLPKPSRLERQATAAGFTAEGCAALARYATDGRTDVLGDVRGVQAAKALSALAEYHDGRLALFEDDAGLLVLAETEPENVFRERSVDVETGGRL